MSIQAMTDDVDPVNIAQNEQREDDESSSRRCEEVTANLDGTTEPLHHDSLNEFHEGPRLVHVERLYASNEQRRSDADESRDSSVEHNSIAIDESSGQALLTADDHGPVTVQAVNEHNGRNYGFAVISGHPNNMEQETDTAWESNSATNERGEQVDAMQFSNENEAVIEQNVGNDQFPVISRQSNHMEQEANIPLFNPTNGRNEQGYAMHFSNEFDSDDICEDGKKDDDYESYYTFVEGDDDCQSISSSEL